MMCLLLAGIGQPLAMHLFMFAPWLAPDNPALARDLVRLATLFGPVVVLGMLAVLAPREVPPRDMLRMWAWVPALILMMARSGHFGLGLDHNAVPRGVPALADAHGRCVVLFAVRAMHTKAKLLVAARRPELRCRRCRHMHWGAIRLRLADHGRHRRTLRPLYRDR